VRSSILAERRLFPLSCEVPEGLGDLSAGVCGAGAVGEVELVVEGAAGASEEVDGVSSWAGLVARYVLITFWWVATGFSMLLASKSLGLGLRTRLFT
jgi:hypothetical protein